MTGERARAVCENRLGLTPGRVERLATGLCNRVYRVEVSGPRVEVPGSRVEAPGSRVVVRFSDSERHVAGSLNWLKLLASVGVPVPVALCSGVEGAAFYIVMTCLEGEDLGRAYDSLSRPDRVAIARAVDRAQRAAATLPEARGFGYLASYDDATNMRRSWKDVVLAHIGRSRDRIARNGLFDPAYADRVESLVPAYDRYLASIRPTPFLDDATTKNVLVQDGRLSGIVDVDWLCFGDRLYAIALTRMSLLAAGQDPEYADFLAREAGVGDDGRAALDLYALAFCLDFMSEKGMAFNTDRPEPVDAAVLRSLEARFETLHAAIGRSLGRNRA